MPTPITFTLTDAGLSAALDADANGLTLSLTQIAIGSGQYAPLATRTALQTEIARYPLSGGDIEPNSKTLRFSAILESVTTQQAFEVGLFTSTGVLFAVASTTGTDPLILVTANITFVGSFGMVLSEIPAGSVTVVTNPNAPLATTLMTQHAAAANPHPQYAMKAAFDGHVSQNGVEHANLLAMIQAVNQRVANLEIREEIQIGEFVITDDPRNPATYKGYGSWRLVPDVLLKGLDSGGTVGQFSQVAAGSDQSVRTTFFWQRFDPNEVVPLRTVYISSDSTDVNLLDLFTATYGAPVIGERAHFIIESGVLITASSTTDYAVVTGEWPLGAQPVLEVFGIVAGRGGKGGRSAYAFGSRLSNLAGEVIESWSLPEAGENGGPAILATSTPLEVINHHIVGGGGGGGGGQGGWWLEDGAGESCGGGGGTGGGAPFGMASPNENTYAAYLLNPTVTSYGVIPDDLPWRAEVILYREDFDSALTGNALENVLTPFGSRAPSGREQNYVVPIYTNEAQGKYVTYGRTTPSVELQMSKDASATQGGQCGYGGANTAYFDFVGASYALDLSVNHGGKGGDIGESGESGVMPKIWNASGVEKTIPSTTVHIPSATGGLAGVAITGPVTVTGNPVLGR